MWYDAAPSEVAHDTVILLDDTVVAVSPLGGDGLSRSATRVPK